MSTSSFGQRLADIRNAIGLTQQELGDRVGVTRQQVMRWEKDKQGAPQKRLPAICEALGITPAQFWDPEWLPGDSGSKKMVDSATDLAARLREARLNRGLSIDEAARSVGISEDTLVTIEGGDEEPDPTTLANLARLYRVTADSLLGIERKNDSFIQPGDTIAANMGRIPVGKLEEFEKQARAKLEEVFAYLKHLEESGENEKD